MSAFLDRARPFVEARVLTSAEVEIVRLVATRFGEGNPEALLGLAFAAAAPRLGHVVIALTEAREVFEDASLRSRDDPADALPWPEDLAAWHACTLQSLLVGPDRPFVAVPLAAGGFGLATHRRNAEEAHVAALVRARARAPRTPPQRVETLIDEVFGADRAGEAAHAVRVCSGHSLTIITGGPGTGKTFSITRLLAVLALAAPEAPPRVRLAAPTGKAAARMGEAIAEGLASLSLPAAARAALGSLRAETVHRAIGLRPDGTARFDEENPLRADLVVVDEASMIDLALMRALLRAVPLSARLVLLGDPDQLASVEAGAVLDDFVHAPELAGNRVHFTVSRRFGDAPTLAACAHAMQTPFRSLPTRAHLENAPQSVKPQAESQAESYADSYAEGRKSSGPARQLALFDTSAPAPRGDDARRHEATALLRGERVAPNDSRTDRLTWLGPLHGPGGTLAREQWQALAAPYERGYLAALHALPKNPDDGELAKLLVALDRYRVLAVHRRGTTGVLTLQHELEARLLGAQAHGAVHAGRLRHGLPILVVETAPDAHLTNGDVGIAVEIHGALSCIFPGESRHTVRHIAPVRLPAFEGAFAMTVHKAQGSQFREVALVLAGRASPIQTRELVYTAITRAREAVRWVGGAHELDEALRTRTRRRSTLRERLARGEGAP